MAATWATSSVRSSAISAKNAGFVSGPFRFRSHSQTGVSFERVHLSWNFEITAWTRKYCSVCQHLWSVKSSTSIPALRAWLLSRSQFGNFVLTHKWACPSRTCESKFCLTGTVNIRLDFAQKEKTRFKLRTTSTRQTCVFALKRTYPFASLKYRFKLRWFPAFSL